MKTTLVLKLSQENFDVLAGSDGGGTAGAPYFSLDVAYHRAVAGEDDDTAPEVVVQVERMTFTGPGVQTLELGTIEGDVLDLAILGSDGRVVTLRGLKPAPRVEYFITKEDADAVIAARPSAPEPTSVMTARRAQLVATGSVTPR